MWRTPVFPLRDDKIVKILALKNEEKIVEIWSYIVPVLPMSPNVNKFKNIENLFILLNQRFLLQLIRKYYLSVGIF